MIGGLVEQTFFLSSSGASLKNLTNGEITFNLTEPFFIQDGSYLSCSQFTFVNDFRNISSTLGNNMIYYTDDSADATKYSITIPDGYWSVSALSSYLAEQQTVAGTSVFTLEALASIGKIGIRFDGTNTGWWVYFDTDSPFDILGFTSGQSVPDFITSPLGSTANLLEYAPNRGDMLIITAIKVGTNITANSYSNTAKSNVIIQFPILEEPLATTAFEPNNISFIPIRNGGLYNSITIYVYDQNNDPLEMLEDFSLVLNIGPKI